MKNKRIKLICTALGVSSVMLAFSAGATFDKTRSYDESPFGDVSKEAWYYKDVSSAYELGLVNGKSQGAFDPDGTMTVSEGLTLAARMNVLYNNKEVLVQTDGGNWYDVYVNYALQNGFLKENQFDSYTRPITRSEMAKIFAAALPKDYYTAKNNILKIPDVKANSDFYEELMTLYNAGVVMGNDEFGTFNPTSLIKRSEVSAIVNRVAVPENRLSKQLAVRKSGVSYTLSHNINYNSLKSGIASGWSFDNQGGPLKTAIGGTYNITDGSKEYGVSMIRDLSIVSDGLVTLETNFSYIKGFNGFYVQFNGSNEKATYKLLAQDDAFNIVNSDGSLTKIWQKPENLKNTALKITLDLDAKTSTTVINQVECGTFPLTGTDIKNYRFGSTDEGVLTVNPATTNIYGNYFVNDDFTFDNANKTPYEWTSSADEGIAAVVKGGEFQIIAPEGVKGSGTGTRYFKALTDKMAFDTMILQTKYMDSSYTLRSGAIDAVKFETKDGKFYANGKELRSYNENFWYTIRIEADIVNAKAKIKACGKYIGEVDFLNNVSNIDNFILVGNGENATMKTDNYKVSALVDYADYIPEPVRPEGDENYNIGINICSLWKNDSTHYGWDCITPFDEIRPLIGYYDEGSPEVADWEIKWMAEHGLDFELYCWYSSTSNSPIKTTNLSSAIHDGYFNAKYSDKIDFALLWEAANANHPEGSEAFRKYFVPYWEEYFFSDERYMTIDNKLVMAVFGAGQLMKDFGGAVGVKAEFDYLRSESVRMGFDGMIILACGGSTKELKECGFDGCYAYNWGTEGYKITTTKKAITSNMENGFVHTVPTISTGFNNIGWAGQRHPNMTVEDWKSIHTWVRDEILPQYKDDENWKKNFVMLSTWNEYGEGTYIMPSGLNEFGYLDVIREVYTKGGEHTDLKPTDEQLKRVTYMFPQYRHIIRPLLQKSTANVEIPTDVMYSFDFTKAEDIDKFEYWGIEKENTANGITGKASGNDPIFMGKPIEIDVKAVTFLKLTMAGPIDSRFQIYYQIGDVAMSEDTSVGGTIEKEGMQTYYLNVGAKTNWIGTLKKLRLDPINGEGNFEVKSIEFLYDKSKGGSEVMINNVALDLDILPTVIDGKTFIPFNPGRAIHYYLNSYYTWDKDTKVLAIEANKNKIVFTMDSSNAIINGKETDINCKPYLDDGLPMLPLEILCDAIGYKIETVDDKMNIITNEAEKFVKMANRKEGEYTFDVDGDIEGWVQGGISVAAAEGSLFGVTTEDATDPMMWSPKLKLETTKYNKIEISMKHDYTSDKAQKTGFYFITDLSNNWEQNKYISLSLEQKTSGDKFITYTFDMASNAKWKGNLIGLRFDPFDCPGTFEIDFIKLLLDPEYEAKKNAPFALINGDAEKAEVAFTSENADITIVADPKKADNKVYSVLANSGKKSWTYFRQTAQFKSEQKYLVKFDAYLVGLEDGTNVDEATIILNLRYKDTDGKTDHVAGKEAMKKGEWVHFEKEITLAKTDDRSGDQFTIFADPIGEIAISYLIDNVCITEVK